MRWLPSKKLLFNRDFFIILSKHSRNGLLIYKITFNFINDLQIKVLIYLGLNHFKVKIIINFFNLNSRVFIFINDHTTN